MTTAAQTKAKATTKKSPAKAVSHAKPVAPPQVIGEIHLIPLDRIEVRDQVRTSFFEESIEELARDIEARGLRSPVEVTPIGDERYLLTLGGRRLRAIRFLGHKAIPATIVKVSDKDRLLDQLAENIQREDLSLKDEAEAVRQVFEQLKDLDQVAALVKKSKSWVSKRMAAAHPSFGWRARRLLEEGLVGDLELLGTLSQIEKVCSYPEAEKAEKEIRKGQMNRDQAREFLKKAKETAKAQAEKAVDPAVAAKREQALAEAQAERERERKEATEGTGEPFIRFAVDELSEIVAGEYGDLTGDKFLGMLRQDQRDVLEAHLVKIAAGAKAKSFAELAGLFNPYQRSDLDYLEQMAVIAGLQGMELKGGLYAFVAGIEQANKGGE